MLTLEEYNTLWAELRPNGFAQPIAALPSYHEYVQREIYFNDYLDLFRHAISYPRVNIPDPITGDDRFYVYIGLLPVVLAVDEQYIIIFNNKNYLKVDYDYPWDLAELNQERCIRYIMVGEAPPVGNTYFYKVNSQLNTAWLNATNAAFGVNIIQPNRVKANELLQLANNGYLLIDIFPFNVDYEDLRDNIITDGLAELKFVEVLNKIDGFNINGLICEQGAAFGRNILPPYNERAIIAFSGPPKIHHYLAGLINAHVITLYPYLFCYSVLNNMVPGPVLPAPVPNFLIMWLHVDLLNGIYPNPHITRAPIFRCCCYDGTLMNPNQIFIKNAFGLPI